MAKTVISPKLTAKTAAKKIDFSFFAPESKKVQLAGSFNSWNPEKTNLKKSKDGKWKTTLSLIPGRYEYKFVIDGDWQNDQNPVECIPNGVGGWNCVIEVK